MQFTTAFVAACAAGLANAAALPRNTQTFDISFFTFSGTPHSVEAIYDFNVTNDANTPSVECQTYTSTSPSIATFGLTACKDPNWSFAWEPLNESNNTQVRIVFQPYGLPETSNVTATREFTPADIKLQEGVTPTGNVYYLDTGATGGNFTLTAQ